VPRVLAALLGVAGVGYAFDSVATVLVGHGAPTIGEFTFLGEVLLVVWLIVWSRRLPRGQAHAPGSWSMTAAGGMVGGLLVGSGLLLP